MIDTLGTRYEIENVGCNLWFFEKWHNFLKKNGLQKFEDFLQLTGKEMDRNRGSVVYRVELGKDKQVFFIKIHTNYYTRNIKTFFNCISYTQIELANMMHYARAGLDQIDPVAWGWQKDPEFVSFLLLKELDGYMSLQEWFQSEDATSFKARRFVGKAVAQMLAQMHSNGLAHIDLFTWHVFLKNENDGYTAHPIDLERTKIAGKWAWMNWLIRRRQANDLAVLHLTTPWPQICAFERMRFFVEYSTIMGMTKRQKKSFFNIVIAVSKRRGRKGKFKRFGVADRFHGRG